MEQKIIICMISLFLLAIFLCGCEAETDMPIDDNHPALDDNSSTTEGVSLTVDANNQFALELYAELKQGNEGNIFFSPFSISDALAMTYEGARGQTAEEMQSVLHFPTDDLTRRSSYAKLYNTINKPGKKYQLSTANALWAQQDYVFLQEYFDTVENFYGGKATNLDFVRDTENSRITINNWVEEQTNDKIKDLLPLGAVNDMTRLVLTNAIYFKGTWVKQFDKDDTREQDFKVNEDKTIKAEMMHMAEEHFNHAEDDDFQVLELPYEGDDISMLILLPKNKTLNELPLTSQQIAAYRTKLEKTEIAVFLPKFRFDTKYFLVDTLSQMGMPRAFGENSDFSGMTGSKELFISKVIHQAFVQVDEEGTEAAASTAVVVAFRAIPMIKVFVVDHPFIFIIQEKATGTILFMGRVMDPTAK